RAVLSGGSFGALENGRSYVLVLRQLRRSGDVDGSGSVDYRDAFYVYMLTSGLVDTLTVSPAWRRAADVDEDGAVAGDMDDFRLIFDMVSSIPGRDPRSAAKSKDESSGPLLAGSAGSLRIEFPDGSLLEAAGDGWPQAIPAGSLASGFLESSLKLTSPAPGLVKLPAAATLAQNQPNPFNPSTTISFSLAREGRASLAVYDLRGRLVKVLASGNRAAGSHTRTWDGADSNGRRLASGIYVYRLIAGETILTRKMVLVK
ncbi:MAG TPA: FlgD immunoglobulin-like domain containing protein, partial [Candidatus Glassbacteria bacterium]|nr:FlgD immunoglobulin-like domain containing protein [Candidatus Glassbacteria bacterium]